MSRCMRISASDDIRSCPMVALIRLCSRRGALAFLSDAKYYDLSFIPIIIIIIIIIIIKHIYKPHFRGMPQMR